MPYIDDRLREDLRFRAPETTGELNYTLADTVDRYLFRRGVNYKTLNDVIGVLECLKLEVYRRIAAPYEDRKLSENGEVFHRSMKQEST